MNYLKIGLKIGPWIACVLLMAALWVVHGRSSAKDIEIEALKGANTFATETLTDYATALDQRDEAIKRQSASIDALKAAADAGRVEYDKRLAVAKQAAGAEKDKATSLLALSAPEGELAQCRAARDLLEKELVE
ncbi:hypothetical protein [Novosphingobium sp.]|uniref:hypothetical protein n=1 Tax=Novosphingobium sp. TaxID=1874826 RepID=UPI003D6CBAA5